MQRVVVTTVDVLGGPSLDCEPRPDSAWPAQAGRSVVDDDDRQISQPSATRILDRLGVASLVQLRVADENDHARVGTSERQRRRRAGSQSDAVPQRTRGDLHAWYERAVRVITEGGVEPSESVELFFGEESRRREDT